MVVGRFPQPNEDIHDWELNASYHESSEYHRCRGNGYVVPVWHGQISNNSIKDEYHYAHVDPKNPEWVFYNSKLKSTEIKKIKMRPGRYLAKFSSLSEASIVGWTNQFKAKHCEVPTLFLARTEEECEWVYEKGPDSCMGGVSAWDKFKLKKHPARAYAAGDLAVAYTTRNNKPPDMQKNKNRPNARTIVWPERKIYINKIYGDTARLLMALHVEGYKEGCIWGARMKKIPHTQEKTHPNGKTNITVTNYLMPYVDVCQTFRDLDKQYFQIQEAKKHIKTYGAVNTHGFAFDVIGNCSECDASIIKGDHFRSVYKYDLVCSSCAVKQEDLGTCWGCDIRVHRKDIVTVKKLKERRNGILRERVFCPRCAKHEVIKCKHCKNHVPAHRYLGVHQKCHYCVQEEREERSKSL
jgi:hypothetical protein